MITYEEALSIIDGYVGESLTIFIGNRLRGFFCVKQLSSPNFDNAPEDMVIVLLESEKLDKKIRHTILEEIVRQFLIPFVEKERFIRLCRILDIVHPPELKEIALRNLVSLCMEDPQDIDYDVLKELLRAAARAYVGYRSDFWLWETILYKKPVIAAYAFQAMLKIGLLPEKANLYLTELEKDKYKGLVDIGYFKKELERKCNEHL